ncbi:MAG: TIGR03560 family F420-dependent LLM class oxidoreductase [Candidatus Limnocylindrales bacterium]
MRFSLMIEPQQGLTYAEQLAIARRAEALGFETLFRSDHYESFPGKAGSPTTDAWAVLAGLARETTTIKLGALVSPVTFRTPGNLAKVAVTVDEMSGGRIELGLGAGWHEHEHVAHGFPFPPIEERAERLEETLEILHGLWEGPDGWSFAGRHYTVEDALFRPKPASLPGRDGGRPNLITGGGGSPRAFRIAARHADEFNLSSSSPEVAAEKFAALDAACEAIGREPSSLTHSTMAGVLLGRDEDELRRREAAIADLFGGAGEDFDAWFAERKPRWIYGGRDQAREAVARFEAAGAERLMLQDFLPWDLPMIDLMAEMLF